MKANYTFHARQAYRTEAGHLILGDPIEVTVMADSRAQAKKDAALLVDDDTTELYLVKIEEV